MPTFGKGVVFDVDHLVRQEQFRFFAEALKTSKLKTYVDVMVKEAEVRGRGGGGGREGGGRHGVRR